MAVGLLLTIEHQRDPVCGHGIQGDQLVQHLQHTVTFVHSIIQWWQRRNANTPSQAPVQRLHSIDV